MQHSQIKTKNKKSPTILQMIKVQKIVLITYYRIKANKQNKNNKTKQREKSKEKRKYKRHLNLIMVYLTNTPHTSIYKIFHGMSYNMNFNRMNVTK